MALISRTLSDQLAGVCHACMHDCCGCGHEYLGHGNPLRYCRNAARGSQQITMAGTMFYPGL